MWLRIDAARPGRLSVVAVDEEALRVERERHHEANRLFPGFPKDALGVERHEVDAQADGIVFGFCEADRGARAVERPP